MASSLDGTRSDAGEIGVELRALSDELEALQADAASPAGGPQLRLFVILLLAWIAVPAVGGLILGLTILLTRAGPRAT